MPHEEKVARGKKGFLSFGLKSILSAFLLLQGSNSLSWGKDKH